jgi:UDP-glucose 4-epimerase
MTDKYTVAMKKRYAITGGAGFIGSHFVDALLALGNEVIAIDNLCSGTIERISHNLSNPKFSFQKMNVEDTENLCTVLSGVHTVIHLASNPDIAKAVKEPRIDFTQGTVLTESVAEAARKMKVSKILYASGSGVYGDAGENVLTEDSPLNPISTYGASKLAGESILSAYSYMFGIQTKSFRFANVVGSRQTHGVGLDFINRLRINPRELTVLGDGYQSKSYIHITDIIEAVLLAEDYSGSLYDVYNVSTSDNITVNEIALGAFKVLGIESSKVSMIYTGGSRGWKADVPVVRLSSDKISKLGWTSSLSSKEAVEKSLKSMTLQNF